MPVVLTDDLADLRSQEVQDYAKSLRDSTPTSSDSLTNPLAGASSPTPDTGAAPSPVPPSPPADTAVPAASASSPPSTGDFNSALDWGKQQIGKGYIWGSAGGRSDLSGTAPGYDCSGFVSQFYHQMGRSVPAQTSAAYAATTPLAEKDAQPGDIVEFNMNSNDPHEQHIAIYLGNGQILQSGGTRHDVNIGTVGQFGPGTYEFRRAAGGPPSTDSAATSSVASTVAPLATPLPNETNDQQNQINAFKDTPPNPVQSAYAYAASLPSAVADTAGKTWDSATSYAASLLPQSDASGMAAGQQPTPSDTLTNPLGGPQPESTQSLLQPVADAASAVNGALPGIASDIGAGTGAALGGLVGPAGADAVAQAGRAAVSAAGDYVSNAQKTPLNADDPNWVLGASEGAVTDAQAAVDALAAKFPLMTQGALDASGAGRALAAAKAAGGDVAGTAPELADTAAPTSAATVPPPSMPEPVAPTAPLSRDDLVATLKQYPQETQDGLTQFAQDQSKAGASGKTINDALRAWVKDNPLAGSAADEVPALGADVAPAAEAPAVPTDTPPSVQVDSNGNVVSGELPPVDPTTPPDYQRIAQQYVNEAHTDTGVFKPKNVAPDGSIQEGINNLPGKAGGAVEKPSKIISANVPSADTTPPVPDSWFPRRITPEMMQSAYEQINGAAKATPDSYDQFNQLVQSGATPDELARFMAGIKGTGPTVAGAVRTLRTGALAGGVTTEGKVLLSPVIQTAMNGSIGALKALVTGHPGDIAKGMQGGLAGLADGAYNGLQTLRYGISDDAVFGGGASGGYGHTPGIDVLGSNSLQRAAGTATLGLVRTHGAVADVTAGIAHGAALATGATPAAATEAGQQAALRSGNFGSTGQMVNNALESLKGKGATNILGQVLVPFYRVGYSSFTQGIEKSPVGLLGTAADLVRAKFPESWGPAVRGPYAAGADASHVTPVGQRLANNFFGVGLATVGLAEAVNGNITGENPTGGAPKWSLRVPETAQLPLGLEHFAQRDGQGNLWIPLRTLGPAQEALAQSAGLYESIRDGNSDVAKTAAVTAGEFVSHVRDETWLRSVSDVMNLIGDGANLANPRQAAAGAKGLETFVTNQRNSVIPEDALGRNVVKATPNLSWPSFVSPAAPASSGGSTRTARPTRASLVPPRPSVRSRP